MTIARKLLAAAALGLAACAAQAGNINWSIGINLPPVGTVISNAPHYYDDHRSYPGVGSYYSPPPQVVYRPAPVYYSQPPVVVYRPVPIYAGPPAYVVERRGGHHRHWNRRGHDGYHGYHGHRGQHDRHGWRRDRDD